MTLLGLTGEPVPGRREPRPPQSITKDGAAGAASFLERPFAARTALHRFLADPSPPGVPATLAVTSAG